jgi:hypothetical protein
MNTTGATLTSPSAAIMAKAQHLLSTGGVTPANRAGVYRVRASNGGSYLVLTAGNCECPARVAECAHLMAARLFVADSLREQAAKGAAADKIREAMDAIRARDIAAIRASTVTGAPICARCACNTVHGHTVLGAWYCLDIETCESRRSGRTMTVAADVLDTLRADAAKRGIVVLRGPSPLEMLGSPEETDLYGPAEHCGLDECDCGDYAN